MVNNIDFETQFKQAKQAGLAALGEPRAKTARYSRARRKFVVELTNGCTFMFPVDMAQGLTGATDSQLADVEVLGSGFGLHWEKLDADLSIPALIVGTFGSKAWMQELARRGGSVTSPTKAAAARSNGAKGGRPIKRA